MVIDKHNLKKNSNQQGSNISVRKELKRLNNLKGLETQGNTKISDIERNSFQGGIKRVVGGKAYHSRKYKLIPAVEPEFNGGKKTKKMSGGVRAKNYGLELGQMIKSDKEMCKLVGGGFWKDFVKGFNMVMKPAGAVMSMLPDPRAKALGVGLTGLSTGLDKLSGNGKKNKGTSNWIQFVKDVARKKNISYKEALSVASKMKKNKNNN